MDIVAQYIEVLSNAVSTLNQGNILAMLALLVILVLGELGVPFPFILQGVLFFIGYQISKGTIYVLPIIAILLLGRQIGCAFVYWMGRSSANPFINWLEKHFRPVRNDIEKIKGRLQSRSPLVIAAGRLTPGLLVPTSLACGAIAMRYDYFVLGVVLSELLWDGSFIVSGILIGYGVEHLNIHSTWWLIPLGFVVVIGLTWLIGRYLSQRKTGYQ